MARIRVVTDSTADVEGEEAQRLGITIVPLNVHWNGDTYEDKVELSIDEFYRKLREEKGTPKTSQPSVGQFEQEYRRLLGEADGIVSIHLAAKLSGTFNCAQVAARNVAPDRISVIDTRTLTMPLGYVALQVARLGESGASLEECVTLAHSLIPRLRVLFALDTLEFLRRGGRIGRAQALAGGLLSIKPILQILDGEVLPVNRVRTRAASVKRLVEVVRDLGPMEALFVLYGDDPQPAQQVLVLLAEVYPDIRIVSGRIGSVLGTHTGPGVFAIGGVLDGRS